VTTSQKLVKTPIDTTPADPPAPVVSGFIPKYFGEGEKFRIVAARNKITQYTHKTSGDIVTIIRDFQFIKTKEFSAIIGEKTNYIVIIYQDDGEKILEINKDDVILTNNGDSLAPEFKTFEALLGASAISVPGVVLPTPEPVNISAPVNNQAPPANSQILQVGANSKNGASTPAPIRRK
jgi:hypothetical protein